jgi:ribosome maturation factor RimP
MSIDSQIHSITQKVNSLISGEPGYFLVEVKIRPTNNVKVFIDADNGISIDNLAKYNRSLYKEIDESGLFPNGDFSLEVSSSGLDEPLKLHRQFIKNIGKEVEVILKNGIKKEGKLLSADENEIIIEEEKNPHNMKGGHGKAKQKEMIQHIISLNDIKTIKIQIKF